MISLATGTNTCNETLQKLFYYFQLDDAIFNNRNGEFLNSLITKGNSAFYEDDFLQPEDMLYYKVKGNWETYSVAMADLVIYAVEEYYKHKKCSRCIFFRCIHTGTFYELSGVESDQLPLEEESSYYAYKISMTDEKLRSYKYVTMYNQRTYKLQTYLKASENE